MIANLNEIERMCFERKPKLCLCTEARLTSDIVYSEFKIDGYTPIVCHAQSRFTGGVIIYVKNTLKFKVIENIYKEKLMWCLAIELLDISLKGIFAVTYRSPAFNLNSCSEFFDEFLEKIVNLNKLNIIVGDININMNENSSSATSLKCLFNKHGLDLIVDFNTRVTNTSQTQIDYVVTNMKNRVSCKVIPSEKISDHETIGIIVKKESTEKVTYEYVLTWAGYNKSNLIENLRKCDWSNFDPADIDHKLEILRTNILTSVSSLTKYVKINNTAKPKKWFDSELSAIKSDKIEKYNNWSSNKCDNLWNEYINIRNNYNKLIKFKKNEHTRNQIISAGNNQTRMWKCLNGLISNKNNKTSDVISFDDGESSDPLEISEKFNAYFVNSIIELNRNIQPSTMVNNFIEQSDKIFKFELTNIDQVTEIAKQQTKKVNKADRCNSQVWYDAIEYCGFFLTKIINESMSVGYFPSIWKTSTVVPIPKITNTKNAAEHRGINMLPIEEKICEIIIKDQLVAYIESNYMLSPYQSAFRSNHSCESTLNFVINEWKISMDDGLYVVAIGLDLKRAFETVDRELMINKLQAMGIHGIELSWFESYLTTRKQQTKYKNNMSSEIDVPIGLPQGSTLGVILFNIYINSITKVPENSSIVLFADDTVLVTKNKNIETAIRHVNADLSRISDWLKKNKLMLNTKKTNYMILTKNNLNETSIPEVKIDNETISRVTEFKYLGVLIDNKLNLKEQAFNCTKKAASKTNLLSRISKNLTFDTKKIIFNSIVLPSFQYCSTIYLGNNKEEIGQMQLIQNRAMRLILKCEFLTPIDFMLKSLNWLSISQMIKFNALVYIHKMLKGLLPGYLSDKLILTNTVHNRYTRQNNDFSLRLPNYTSTFTQKNLFYNGVKLYNDLPNEIKKSESLNIFKIKCKKHIIENYPIL